MEILWNLFCSLEAVASVFYPIIKEASLKEDFLVNLGSIELEFTKKERHAVHSRIQFLLL